MISQALLDSKAVMHRIANPCRSVRLRPAPPKLCLSDVDEDSTRKLSISSWQLSALDVRHNIAHIECAAGPQPKGQSSLADLTQYAAGLPPKSSGQLRLLARITPNQVQEPVPAEKAWLRRAPGPSWASALVCDPSGSPPPRQAPIGPMFHALNPMGAQLTLACSALAFGRLSVGLNFAGSSH